mmetsp:Transcript_7848/g.19488  ORF Transcript_7848/g.19488 Transcript_7848/m.19488 type:complete len:389 (-) Transcript_7848:1847-3013(-)
MNDFIWTQPPSLFVGGHEGESRTIVTTSAQEALLGAPNFHPRLKMLNKLCSGIVVVQMTCGHTSKPIACSRILRILGSKKLPAYEAVVQIPRDCGYLFETQYWKQNESIPMCKVPVNDMFAYPSCKYGQRVRPGSCGKLPELHAIDDPIYPEEITSTRSRCGHSVRVPCHIESAVLQHTVGLCIISTSLWKEVVVEEGVDCRNSELSVPDCKEPVTYLRSCGHEEADIPCHKAFSWAAFPDDVPPSTQMVPMDSPLCGHEVDFRCSKARSVAGTVVWNKLPSRISFGWKGDMVMTCPVIHEGVQTLNWTSDVGALRCGMFSRYLRLCGHEEKIACHDIFKVTKSKCGHVLVATCESCGQDRRFKCFEQGDPSKVCAAISLKSAVQFAE